jgi:hypothetical protein
MSWAMSLASVNNFWMASFRFKALTPCSQRPIGQEQGSAWDKRRRIAKSVRPYATSRCPVLTVFRIAEQGGRT